jgi:acylphosphatase
MSNNSGALGGRVTGVVQGVSFRAATEKEARRLGISGWVRNCSNGDVEVLIAGNPDALLEMHRWLHQGPQLAQVETVDLHPCPDPGLADFSVRY